MVAGMGIWDMYGKDMITLHAPLWKGQPLCEENGFSI
jgi:hypothetical protein